MSKSHLIDPRKAQAIAYYQDPRSETFANRKQSMIRAGYDEKYADTIAGRAKWLSESIEKGVEMIKKAESNLNEDLQIESYDGDGKYNVDKARLRLDATKFVLKTLAKAKYSDSKDDQPPSIQINIVNYNDDKASKDKPGTIDGNKDTIIE